MAYFQQDRGWLTLGLVRSTLTNGYELKRRRSIVSQQDGPNPQRIFQLINAYQASATLKGALELGLFTALGNKNKTAAELAESIGASERGVRILCDFLVIGDLLQKEGTEYRSSPDAALFLDENSPAYFGSVGRFMLSGDLFNNFSDIAAVVRKGGTLLDGAGTVEPNHPIWVEFARSMMPLMQPSAAYIGELIKQSVDADQPLKVLDVAAGHGLFGIAAATRHPQAQVVALDWPAVLEVACENAEKAGVADRYTRLAGDAFELDFGEGYDIILLTNFLHHYDMSTCTTLLRKVHRALKDGGRAITLEFVPNDDRVTPPEQASFSMMMLATTACGDAYTFRQLSDMAAEAGFTGSEMHRLEEVPQSVIVSTK